MIELLLASSSLFSSEKNDRSSEEWEKHLLQVRERFPSCNTALLYWIVHVLSLCIFNYCTADLYSNFWFEIRDSSFGYSEETTGWRMMLWAITYKHNKPATSINIAGDFLSQMLPQLLGAILNTNNDRNVIPIELFASNKQHRHSVLRVHPSCVTFCSLLTH